ncbi:MAG: RNA polymerase sigma factor [Coprobacillaceae bacterium]
MKERIETKIIEEFKHGDEDAFTAVYEHYYKYIYFFIYKHCYNEEKSQDITQNTFVSAYKGKKNLKNNEAFNTWLLRIAYRETQRYFRKEKTYVTSVDGYQEVEELLDTQQLDFTSEVMQRDAIKVVYKAIDSLRPKLKDVAILRYHYGVPIKEIARVLSVPTGTVKSRIHRVNKQIQVELEREEITLDMYRSLSFMPLFLEVFSSRNGIKEITAQLLNKLSTNEEAYDLGVKTIASIVGTAVVVGAIVITQNISWFTEKEAKAKQEIVEDVSIKDLCQFTSIYYDEEFTRESITLDIQTNNKEYDTIYINGKETETIHSNGTYTVSLIKDDKSLDERQIEVTNIDKEAPQLLSTQREGNTFYISLEDSLSGLNEETLMYYFNGIESNDFEYDKEANVIKFNYQDLTSNTFYIEDHAGNWREINIKSKQL